MATWNCLRMRKNLRYILFILAALSISSCAVSLKGLFTSHPKTMKPIKSALMQQQETKKDQVLKDELDTQDSILYAQELGRAAQLKGDFKTSLTYYKQAIAAYNAGDMKALISASEISSNIGSLAINDKVIAYRGAGFERILLHQYQAMNYVMLGRLDSALVETRRANELQSIEQKKFSAENPAGQKLERGVASRQIKLLRDSSGNISNSFLNAYNFYTTGLLHELAQQENDAFIDYRKAAAIAKGNTHIQKDLVRLARELGMPQYKTFKKKWGTSPIKQENQGQLVILYEKGFVLPKKQVFIPLRIKDQVQSVAFPSYPKYNSTQRKVTVAGLPQAFFCEPLADINQLAIKSLEERYTGIILRQIGRLIAKYNINNKPDTSQLSGVFQLTNLVTEQADLRSWLTLPSQTMLGRSYVNAGTYTISIRQKPHTVKITKNKTTLVWAIQVGAHMQYHTITL